MYIYVSRVAPNLDLALQWLSTSTASDVGIQLNMMRLQAFLSTLAAATTVAATKYSLISALASANQPFSEAFVSYSIEFSSFPEFAGKHILEVGLG